MNSHFRWFIGFIFVVNLSSCDKSEVEPTQETTPAAFDTPAQAYQPEAQVPPSTPNSSFNGYVCTDDCSGHEAGYNWAEENGIDDPNNCDGNSESFIEGCESYAEEQQPTPSDEDAE